MAPHCGMSHWPCTGYFELRRAISGAAVNRWIEAVRQVSVCESNFELSHVEMGFGSTDHFPSPFLSSAHFECWFGTGNSPVRRSRYLRGALARLIARTRARLPSLSATDRDDVVSLASLAYLPSLPPSLRLSLLTLHALFRLERGERESEDHGTFSPAGRPTLEQRISPRVALLGFGLAD